MRYHMQLEVKTKSFKGAALLVTNKRWRKNIPETKASNGYGVQVTGAVKKHCSVEMTRLWRNKWDNTEPYKAIYLIVMAPFLDT